MGVVYGEGDKLLLVELAGVGFILGWVILVMTPFFVLLKIMGLFRVDELEELVGLDIAHHKGAAYDINVAEEDGKQADVNGGPIDPANMVLLAAAMDIEKGVVEDSEPSNEQNVLPKESAEIMEETKPVLALVPAPTSEPELEPESEGEENQANLEDDFQIVAPRRKRKKKKKKNVIVQDDGIASDDDDDDSMVYRNKNYYDILSGTLA